MSGDRTGGPGWGFDGGTLAALRLARARAAEEAQDPALALVEAEELLDQEPAQVDALIVSGRALMWLGDAHAAAAALTQVLAQRPQDAPTWSRLAWAHLHAADPQGARHAADRALELPGGDDEDRARALFVRGQLALRDGLPEAAGDLGQAAALAPEHFPSPRPVAEVAFRRALEAARRALPAAVRAFLEDADLEVQDRPRLEDLRRDTPPASLLVPALALGAPPEEEDPPSQPERILLYRENLAWPPHSSARELEERIHTALLDLYLDWTGEDPTGSTED